MITLTEFAVFSLAICLQVAFLGILSSQEPSPTSKSLRTFFIFSLLWIVAEFVAAQVERVELRVWIQRTSGTIGIVLPLLYTRFAYALRYRKYDRAFYFVAAMNISAALVYLTTNLGIDSVANKNEYHVVHFGAFFWQILLVALVNWIFTVWVMHRAMKEQPDYESARRVSILMLQAGTTLLSVAGIVGFLLSSLFWEKSAFFRYIPILSILFIPFFLVAFYRYGFLSSGIEQLARDIFHGASDGIIIADERGIVRQINPMALFLCGLSHRQSTGIPLTELLHRDIHPLTKMQFDLPANPTLHRPFYLTVSITPVISHIGAYQHLVVLQDVTDEKKAEEALSKSKEEFEQDILKRTEELIELQEKEAIGAMAGSIAHDFNNLLAAVLGFATAAHQDAGEGTALKRDLEEILSSSRQARSIVHHLLLFSRRQKSTRKPTDAQAAVSAAMALVESSLPPNMRLQYTANRETAYVMANETDLSQMVMNLCANGIVSMHGRDATLMVSSEVDRIRDERFTYLGRQAGKSNICVMVGYFGAANTEHIQSDITASSLYQWHDMADVDISTTISIAEENGGGISIENNLPSNLIFAIWLPRLETGYDGDGLGLLKLSGGEHIMVVDDDGQLLRLIVRILSSVGYRVTTFGNPEEALTAFRRAPGSFDLVVTDFSMPIFSGIELGRRLLEERADLPILLMSGNATDAQVDTAANEGINRFLSKPFSREELLQTVRDILDECATPSVIP